jgi:hypothetical protein
MNSVEMQVRNGVRRLADELTGKQDETNNAVASPEPMA